MSNFEPRQNDFVFDYESGSCYSNVNMLLYLLFISLCLMVKVHTTVPLAVFRVERSRKRNGEGFDSIGFTFFRPNNWADSLQHTPGAVAFLGEPIFVSFRFLGRSVMRNVVEPCRPYRFPWRFIMVERTGLFPLDAH